MKRLAENEVLSINKLLQMETNGLALSKATIKMMEDEDLREMAQSGINATEARIKALHQFISENNIIPTQEVQ